MTDLYSRPYEPNPDRCCEACVFGRGEHAPFCVPLTDEAIEDSGVPAGLRYAGRDLRLGVTFFQNENAPELAEDLIDTVIASAL